MNVAAEALSDVVELDPFLLAFRTYMSRVGTFRGTATELLQELNAVKGTFKGNRWPKNCQEISCRLRRDAKLLPDVAMELGIREGHKRTRLIVARSKVAVEKPEEEREVAKAKAKAVSVSRRKVASKEPADEQPGLFSAA